MKLDTRSFRAKTVASLLLGSAVGIGLCAQTATAETPQAGGTLEFVVAGEAPSKDGHREQTYALIHPYAPFYSLLIRVNPEDPQSSDFVCDICVGGIPEPTNGATTAPPLHPSDGPSGGLLGGLPGGLLGGLPGGLLGGGVGGFDRDGAGFVSTGA